MRLFIAIDVDNKDYFKEIQKQLPVSKATYPSQFHLTLKFLGDTEEKQAIIECLKQIRFKPFTLKTTHLGVFPSESYIRVVWLGLEENKQLTKLQEDIEKALEKFNFKKDFDFHPHITLARIKFLAPEQKQLFVDSLKNIKFQPKEFKITEFKLISSELTKEGPIYKDIEVFS
ncbi:RNA 2',3'-cyclic phosphodiesterase [Candidatus Woesearchaeota archaeon]|nr:RNA 2',3'-cyclic phosphodiesterase [Candidatus Woesearchaeota archaeon]